MYWKYIEWTMPQVTVKVSCDCSDGHLISVEAITLHTFIKRTEEYKCLPEMRMRGDGAKGWLKNHASAYSLLF